MAVIGSNPLTIEDVWRVAVLGEEVSLDETARDHILESRRRVEKILEEKKTVYGINTGFGNFSNVRISGEELKLLQRNLILSHAVGVGDPLPAETVRAIMLLRINALALGFSGITLEAVEALTEMINKGVHPVVPSQGSVGASGDLAPLAHVMLVLIGEGEADYRGERLAGKEAMKRAGIKTHTLLAKEGLALINGTQVMTAIGALALYRVKRLSVLSDIVGAMSLDALLGTDKAFDERINLLRPHRGQGAAATNLRELLKGSAIRASHLDCEEVQDAYSLRCMPQVHGASKDALRYAVNVVETEINSVTDNPLIFEDEAISGGNFHGQPVALAMDFMKTAVAEWGNISERRIDRLVHPAYNRGLPAFLTEKGGVNSGWMIPQYVAASLVSENKILAHPASVDSIPTSAGKEDHVSMGTIAARQLQMITENVYYIYAIEAMAAAQGLTYRKPNRGGEGVDIAASLILDRMPPLNEDRWFKPEIEAVRDLFYSGDFIEIVEKALGKPLLP